MQHTACTTTAQIPFGWMLLALFVTAAAAGSAQALSPSETKTVNERYKQERSRCLDGSSNQDRATCLREAGASRAEALKNGLGNSAEPYTDNQRQRCAALSGDQRSACLARMRGQGTTSGSVAEGGVLRELVTIVPAAAASASPASPAASSASR